jgi:hypothetical protein
MSTLLQEDPSPPSLLPCDPRISWANLFNHNLIPIPNLATGKQHLAATYVSVKQIELKNLFIAQKYKNSKQHTTELQI